MNDHHRPLRDEPCLDPPPDGPPAEYCPLQAARDSMLDRFMDCLDVYRRAQALGVPVEDIAIRVRLESEGEEPPRLVMVTGHSPDHVKAAAVAEFGAPQLSLWSGAQGWDRAEWAVGGVRVSWQRWTRSNR